MPDSVQSDDNAAIGQRIQERFEFYLIALTFTILGFSFQTAKFGHSGVADGAELIAWLALFASGAVGLWRLEWVPHLYFVFAKISENERAAREFQRAQASGTEHVGVAGENRTVSLTSLVEGKVGAMKSLAARADVIEKAGQRKYSFQRWSFLAGIALLVIARGLPRAVAIFGYALR